MAKKVDQEQVEIGEVSDITVDESNPMEITDSQETIQVEKLEEE